MELYKHGLTISFRLFARIVPHGIDAPLGTFCKSSGISAVKYTVPMVFRFI